jgi:hypothetical protein
MTCLALVVREPEDCPDEYIQNYRGKKIFSHAITSNQTLKKKHRIKSINPSMHLRIRLSYLSILDNSGVKTLGILDIDGLNVAVKLLLGAFLVVTLAADADTETEGDALDTGFPDFLVQLGVEADVFGALHTKCISIDDRI